MRSFKPALLILAVTLLLAGCGGSSGPSTSAAGTAAARKAAAVRHSRVRHHRRRSERVRNATPQPNWRPYAGQKVPILVYHDLGTPPASEPYPGLFVSDADFEAEMAWLHHAGYQAITLDEMMNGFFHHGTLPAKPIVVTFDNGYIPQATFAPAVMAKYGWPGVLNEITEDHLDYQHLEGVLKLGWEVDSHSLTHPDLTIASPAELQAQVAGSRRFLQDTFHIPVDSFCYPSSKYNATVIAAVRAAGYTNATAEGHAYATRANPYLLPRFEMETGLPELQADLATPH